VVAADLAHHRRILLTGAPTTAGENNPSGLATRRWTGSFVVSGGVIGAPAAGERRGRR
jgi:hypothetical protein